MHWEALIITLLNIYYFQSDRIFGFSQNADRKTRAVEHRTARSVQWNTNDDCLFNAHRERNNVT